ncbi:MAG: amino acid adenylation domain-containing protein [Planctomycetota bacterium]|jgi:amino acid adenylation domain-containing protein
MRDNSYPLTPLQQGMVYHSLLAPQSGLYVQQLTGDLCEELDVGRFEEAWRRLVARHPVLRTRFHLADEGGFRQEVETDAVPEWTEDDWSHLSDDDRQSRWRRYLDEDRRRGFDFSQCPLMRLALFRMADDHHLFIWTFYHALLDGRSHLHLLKELFDSYEALCRGGDYRGEDSPPYRVFVDWLSRRGFGSAKGFWLETLKGFEAPTQPDMASARAEKASVGDDHGLKDALLTRGDTESLRSFAAGHGVTLGTLVQASWAALLARYSGREDVVFGATRACRHSSVEGAESIIGLLINTVPMRVQLPPDMPVLDWMKTVRSDWVAMRFYEHTPLREIQAWTEFGPARPLFESILVIENYGLNEALRAQGGNWERREFHLLERGNYPLVGLAYGGSRLLLRLGHDRGRFDDEAAARMLEHWQTALLGLATHSEKRVVDLPLLTDAERRMILVDWNRTERRHPRPLCLHQLVEEQAAKTPGKPAVLYEDEVLTYGQLNTAANRLAHHLQSLGVGPEVLVAVCLDRKPALITAVLAVLKAGGAYLPLEPDYPEERVSSMLADAGASVLVTEERFLDRLPSRGLKTIRVDGRPETFENESDENPRSTVTPENLAYAMYTSGSTGRPKLIGVEHRGAVNTVSHTIEVVMSPEELAVVPFADSICFDASVYRIFSPLSAGGSIIMLDSILALPYSRWADSVTALGSAPSVLRMLLRDYSLPESLRVVSVGAEVASDDLLEELARHPQIEKIINFYGPTETTIYCTHSVLMKRGIEPPLADGVSPMSRVVEPNVIGRPIWNVQAYILDAHLCPVPIGVTGELCIGGIAVARGYLNRPESTTERFIADPFGGSDGARIYRTGDLARYLPDGNIAFVGRADHQVKILGQRIELQGIEATLNRHPGVRENVVRVAEDPSGPKHLVAYVAVSPEGGGAGTPEPAADRLRAYLERKLPRFMVPHSFVILGKLPRTSRGKLDFTALPGPSPAAGRPKTEFIAPRTQGEQALAEIWKDVLVADKIGVHDNLFQLGGDSISATRIVSRINHAFGTDLSLSVIFDAPTIADLAGVLTERLPDDSGEREI